jgi:murein tripeptide amidase MpaA
MRQRLLPLLFVSALVLTFFGLQTSAGLSTAVSATVRIPTPEEVLGFVPGDDRKLASWANVVEYFTALSRASDRVKFETLGQSTMGKPFVMATISAPENLARLDEYKRIQELLADPRQLGAPAARDRKAAELIRRGKTIVLITCGIHSTEVGSYLSSMLIAHRLASATDAGTQKILANTIILLVPSLNPDGVDIVKNWYDKTLGTPYEGTSPPELYHKYVGHDDNRDWYAFTQVETQITVDKIHNVWHPQIVHDIHQQGQYNARFFLPPYMPPVEPNVPKQIVEGYTELGEFIAREMRVAHFTGITTNSTYDAWSPSRAYSHYHGGVRLLSETASCKIATPITVKFSQLKKDTGYDPQNESATYGPLWRGGEWHLRDITNYMTTAAFLLLRHAAENREQWLTRFYQINKEAVRPRRAGELWGYELQPSNKNYLFLEAALQKAGVQLDWCQTRRHSVSRFVSLAQPAGSFAKAMIEEQRYPDLRDRAGEPVSPYDVTAHTLSLMTDVIPKPVYAPFKCREADWCDDNILPSYPVSSRIGLYKSHVPAIDEGWTRWVLETNGNRYPYQEIHGDRIATFASVDDSDMRRGNLKSTYDAIIIPDQTASTILKGHETGAMPPELTGGLGSAGVQALREFVAQGGTLVCLNRASTFAIEQFKLPLRDVVADISEKEFFVPGSILRIELDPTSPIAKGMRRDCIAWAEDSPVFEVNETATAGARMSAQSAKVRIIARYPASRSALLSGWLLGEKRIRGKAALVEVTFGKGQIFLFGFRPQYRGQSLATYPLFFNAINARSR